MSQREFFTVSQLTELIQGAINKEPALKGLWVRGEISNFKRHSSGHLYFSIKDKGAVVRAVMFRGNADKLKMKPEDGQDCFFRGYVALYARETQLQFYVEEIENAGAGAEALALEELRKRLAALGYFDPERKKSAPKLPLAVGVISSPTGAVIQDIRNVIARRYPGMPIRLFPSAVQGKDAPESVIRGLMVMESAPVSVVILARGGGSAEDLSVFNREDVVKAVFNCSKPVISAVGHETDITLTDLAADLRASTPSMAAEMAVPEKAELLAAVESLIRRLSECSGRDTRLRGERLSNVANSYVFTDPGRILEPGRRRLRLSSDSYVFSRPERLLDFHRDRLSRLQEKLPESARGYISGVQNRYRQAVIKVEALSPLATLARGYSICKDERGRVVLESGQVAAGQDIYVSLSKGALSCVIRETIDSALIDGNI